MKLIRVIIVFALVPAAVHAQPALDDNITLEKGIVFARAGDQELKLDLAMPREGKGPFPAILCLHGGFWERGSRADLEQTIRVLAKRGYVAVSADYRLAPEARFPAPLEDCKCAVRWLRANAGKYRIDPNAIGVVGHASGGHLACMLGVTVKGDGLEGAGDLTPQARLESSRVQAVVSFFGPTDLNATWPKEILPLLAAFVGAPMSEKPELYRKASPITYVRPGKDQAPFRVFHGSKDPLVPFEQSEKFVNALKDAGIPAQLYRIEDEGHGWRGEKMATSIKLMLGFLDAQLKKRPEPKNAGALR